MAVSLVNDEIFALITPDMCSGKDSALCNIREYLLYIAKLTNEAFNDCVIQFTAFGLRLLLELIVLAVYIDIHHVYRGKPIPEKLSLIQSFSLSSVLSRSTFFRRAFINVFGSKDGRMLVNDMKTLYRTLSRYMHGPPISCLINITPFNLCACVEELRMLRDAAVKVIDLIKKIVYVWILMTGNSI